MLPHELRAHKRAPKKLKEEPIFKPQKRGKLPKPFKGLGGQRIESTGILDVSDDHVVLMYWRNGQLLTDRQFMGYLFCKLPSGDLNPVFEFHWHPSHKGFHCKTPCKTTSDFNNRMLPGAPELKIKTDPNLDPKDHSDRLKLISVFCKSCGIELPDKDPHTKPLW